MNPVIIEFGNQTSEKDVEDLKMLLEDISQKYNFKWHEDTYHKSREKQK